MGDDLKITDDECERWVHGSRSRGFRPRRLLANRLRKAKRLILKTLTVAYPNC
jgi:hypothetical protein